MKRIMLCVALALLAGCWRFSTDVSFTTDPRVLRGTWTGATESACSEALYIPINASMNSSGTRFFAVSNKMLEVFDATNGTKLGGFNLTSATLPVIWSPDGTKIIYLRTTANSSVERAEVNPTTGADLATATLATDFAGTDFNYNNDLTRVAAFVTSNFSGVSRVNLYDVVSGVLIKSKSLTSVYAYTIALNAAGTQMAYSAIDSGKSQIWTHDFNTDLTKKVFEQSGEISFGKPSFFGTNQLVVQFVQQTTNQGPQLGIKRINLTDLSSKDIPVPYGFGARVSADGTRFGYVENDTLFIKNLETNTIVAQKPLTSISQYGSPYGTILSSNSTGSTWLVSGTRVNCSLRAFDAATQDLTPNAKLASDDSQTVVMKFVPTYRDSSSYTLTGTIKVGTNAERNIRGSVSVPQGCSLFDSNNCEKLVPSTSPIQLPYPLTQVHYVNLQYENGDVFEYQVVAVGYRYDQKRVQFFAGNYANGQNKKFLLDPPAAP